jgi:type IV secretory pathway VirB2 component (pilin)
VERSQRVWPTPFRRVVPKMGLILLLGVGSASIAHATNAALPWESGLGVFMKSITGPVAGIISVLAICVCGGLLAMGAELNDIVKRSAQVVLAIGMCVGASVAFADIFTNNNATTTGCQISWVDGGQ